MSCGTPECALCAQRTTRLRLAAAAHVCWEDVGCEKTWWRDDLCHFVEQEEAYYRHRKRPCPAFIRDAVRSYVFDLCMHRNHACALQTYIEAELSTWEAAPGAPPLWEKQRVPLAGTQ